MSQAPHKFNGPAFGWLLEPALPTPAHGVPWLPKPNLPGIDDGHGAEPQMAIGSGANDVAMLSEAALGIAVLGPEGLAVPALLAAAVLIASIDLVPLAGARRPIASESSVTFGPVGGTRVSVPAHARSARMD